MSFVDFVKAVLKFLFIAFFVAYLLLAFADWEFNPALFDPESRKGTCLIIGLLFFFFLLGLSVSISKNEKDAD